MLKRPSIHVVALLSVATFMTAGCATQNVAKTDEGGVPAASVTRADQSAPSATPAKQVVSAPVSEHTPAQTPAPDQQARKASSTSRLQSALETIYFDFDSVTLSDSARRTLTNNAAALMKEPSAKIRIEGNCDERGSAEYNLALGERRAKSAQQYLVALGVKADRLSTISYGKEKPAAQESSESAWAKNRRDEFVVATP